MTSPEPAGSPSGPARAGLVAWLQEAGRPGRASFRASGNAAVAQTAAIVAGWGALTGLVAAAAPTVTGRGLPVLEGARSAATPQAALLLAMLLAVVARTVLAHRARRLAERGRREVVGALREQVARAVLPTAGSPAVQPADGASRGPAADAGAAGRPSGVQAGHALLELSDQVATYHAATAPVRAAAAPSAALVLAVVALVHWPVAVLLAAATPILPFNLRLAGAATADAGRQQLAAVRNLSAELVDRFRGMRTITTYGAVDRERLTVQRASDELNRATAVVLRRAFVVSTVADAVVTFSIAVAASYVGLVLLGYLHLPGTPSLGFAGGLLVLVLSPVYFAPLRAYAAGYHERDDALAAAALLQPLLAGAAAEPTTRQHLRARSAEGPWPGGAPEVDICGLTVTFPGTERPVLDALDLRLPAGEVAALSAPSGAGKTTLLRVVAGLLAPTAGQVVLRDPGSGVGAAPLAGGAAWIGQQTVLLPGTLAANLALGAPAATHDELAEAALRAGLGPLLSRLPDGLATQVGEQAWGISAGEARRVAVARALLGGASLWLLDEPTAHLDAESAEQVMDALLECAAGRTVLLASHSAAVLQRADVVWRLDRGSIRVETPRPVPA